MHAYLKLSGCYEVQVQQNIGKLCNISYSMGIFLKALIWIEASGRFVMKTDNF